MPRIKTSPLTYKPHCKLCKEQSQVFPQLKPKPLPSYSCSKICPVMCITKGKIKSTPGCATIRNRGVFGARKLFWGVSTRNKPKTSRQPVTYPNDSSAKPSWPSHSKWLHHSERG